MRGGGRLAETRRRIAASAVLTLISLFTTGQHWLPQLVVLAQPAVEAELSVYSRQASYSVPLIPQNGQMYIGLIELLEPLGAVDAKVDGKKYKLRLTPPAGREVEFQFQQGKDKGKVKGDNIKLPAEFTLRNGRGYIPLAAVSEVLARALSTQIRLNAAALRLFVGDIGEHFTLELRSGNPSKLFVSFNAPVNPTIATEPGHIRFTFRKDPVLSTIDRTTYNDPLITGTQFTERDGVGELDVTGTSALMANFADGGKTIVITGVPTPLPQVAQPLPPPSLPANVEAPTPQQKPVSAPRFLVLIDPAHGGDDIGAAITPNLPEKDVVLALAKRVQHELANRGISATLMRNSDASISLEQRAITANAARPALYIALHAANTGRGVHVFTAISDGSVSTTTQFLPWDNAQAGFLDTSLAVAGSVAAELDAHKLPSTLKTAALRPMNNVAAPAFAVEIAPPSEDVNDLAKSSYQDQVAQSIAAGVSAVRNKVPEVRR